MIPLLDTILAGDSPDINTVCKYLSSYLPLCSELEANEYYDVWHYEEESLTHTDVILREIDKLVDEFQLESDERFVLYLAGAFHNLATHLDTESGKSGRVCEIRNSISLRLKGYILGKLSKEKKHFNAVFKATCLIECMNIPVALVAGNAGEHEFRRLCRKTDVKLLYYFLLADVRAHQDPEMKTFLDSLNLFKMTLEDLELWEQVSPYQDWEKAFETDFNEVVAAKDALANSIYDFENEIIHSKEEGLVRSWKFRSAYPKLILLEDEIILQKYSNCEIIHLQNIIDAEEGKQGSPKVFGRALQKAKLLLKQLLADNKNVVWFAHCSEDLRKGITRIAENYGAVISIEKCVKSRKEKKLEAYSLPSVEEAHELILCDEEGNEFFSSP